MSAPISGSRPSYSQPSDLPSASPASGASGSSGPSRASLVGRDAARDITCELIVGILAAAPNAEKAGLGNDAARRELAFSLCAATEGEQLDLDSLKLTSSQAGIVQSNLSLLIPALSSYATADMPAPPGGARHAGIATLLLSPDFRVDGTLLAALDGHRIRDIHAHPENRPHPLIEPRFRNAGITVHIQQGTLDDGSRDRVEFVDGDPPEYAQAHLYPDGPPEDSPQVSARRSAQVDQAAAVERLRFEVEVNFGQHILRDDPQSVRKDFEKILDPDIVPLTAERLRQSLIQSNLKLFKRKEFGDEFPYALYEFVKGACGINRLGVESKNAVLVSLVSLSRGDPLTGVYLRNKPLLFAAIARGILESAAPAEQKQTMLNAIALSMPELVSRLAKSGYADHARSLALLRQPHVVLSKMKDAKAGAHDVQLRPLYLLPGPDIKFMVCGATGPIPGLTAVGANIGGLGGYYYMVPIENLKPKSFDGRKWDGKSLSP